MTNLALSLLFSTLITFVIVRFAHLHSRFSADHDLKGIQKFHAIPVPRIGGGGIFLGFLASAVAMLMLEAKHAKFLLAFMVPCTIVFGIGLAEDLTKRVSVSIRLIFTMLAALAASIMMDHTVRSFDVPLLDTLFQINLIAILFTVIAVAGVANSINLIDGFNGLSSGVSVIAFLAFGAVANSLGDSLVFTLSMTSAGAVLGFMVWNFPKAKIFLGDGGAYLVGFILAQIAILINERHKEVSALFPLLVLLYPIFETLFTIYRRKFVRGISPGAPDAIHLHQLIHKRLVRWNVTNSKESLRSRGNSRTSPYLWALHLSAVVPAVLFWRSPATLACFIFVFMAIYRMFYHRLATFQAPGWLKKSRHAVRRDNTIAISANTAWYVLNFRGGLIKALQERGYKVIVFAPRDEYVPQLLMLGCEYHDLRMKSESTNPLRDLGTMQHYWQLLNQHKPSALLTFTPKSNIYGALAARLHATPVITNVSGLGSAFIRKNWVTSIARILYTIALKHPVKVFFQNEDDQSIFLNLGYVKDSQVGLLPDSGVNIVKFSPAQSQRSSSPFVFMLVARMLRDKGVGEFIEAARAIRAVQPDVRFQLVGFLGTDNTTAITQSEMDAWVAEGVVEYLGQTNNAAAQLANADCVVLPSYQEGTPRTLLEAASMALPIITTDAPGCRNAIDDGVTGYLCKVKDVESLVDCMVRMLALPDDDRRKMGAAGRAKMKGQFNEQIVFDAYLNEIDSVSQFKRPGINSTNAN